MDEKMESEIRAADASWHAAFFGQAAPAVQHRRELLEEVDNLRAKLSKQNACVDRLHYDLHDAKTIREPNMAAEIERLRAAIEAVVDELEVHSQPAVNEDPRQGRVGGSRHGHSRYAQGYAGKLAVAGEEVTKQKKRVATITVYRDERGLFSGSVKIGDVEVPVVGLLLKYAMLGDMLIRADESVTARFEDLDEKGL